MIFEYFQGLNRYNANSEFLRILKTRGPNAMKAFYDALIETGQEHLAKYLGESLSLTNGHENQLPTTSALAEEHEKQ